MVNAEKYRLEKNLQWPLQTFISECWLLSLDQQMTPKHETPVYIQSRYKISRILLLHSDT